MKFTFKAVSQSGEESEGLREAADRFALAREMRREGLTLLSATPLLETARWRKFNWEAVFRRVGIKDLIIFAGSLEAMLESGLSLSRALEVIERQSLNKRLKAVVAEISQKINRGETLSKSLRDFPEVFPLVFVAMVEAGEESGRLPQSIGVVRQQLAKSYDLRRKVRGAMLYPAVIVVVIVALAALMMVFLVPNLVALFRDLEVDLPLSTRLLIFSSDFLTAYWPILLIAGVIVALGAVRFFRRARGRRIFSAVILHLPAIKTIVRNLNAAVTMRTISSLISSGVSMLESIAIAAKVLQNPYYKEVLAEAGPKVEKGGALSAVFKGREDIYPILVGEMAEVGEETGNLADMLLKGAVFFEEEVDQATKNLSTIIEPVLMVLIGAAVALFAISVIGPIYSLTEAL